MPGLTGAGTDVILAPMDDPAAPFPVPGVKHHRPLLVVAVVEVEIVAGQRQQPAFPALPTLQPTVVPARFQPHQGQVLPAGGRNAMLAPPAP